MVIMTPLFAGAAMVTTVGIREGETLPAPRPDQLEFKVAFDSEFTRTTQEMNRWPVVIHCAWRNTSSEAVTVLLKDHDSYHGTLDYPIGIQVRITSKSGRILTTNSQYPAGWWDFSCCASQISHLMPGDIVALNPGEVAVRQFKLDDVLAGLTSTQTAEKAPGLPDGSRDLRSGTIADFEFPEGASTIEVKLRDLVATNALTLQVKKKANKNGAANGSRPNRSGTNRTSSTAGSRR